MTLKKRLAVRMEPTETTRSQRKKMKIVEIKTQRKQQQNIERKKKHSKFRSRETIAKILATEKKKNS